jgi:glycosyltransferase involved in cell wall biosynthesis
MKFCIVVPTYNSLSTLPAAVDSALAQTFDDYVVHVSDNASNDGSVDYLEGLGHAKLSTALHTECVSKTANWNRAFETAPPAEFYVMLHSDDVLYPQALSVLAAAIEREPSAVLYFANHDALSLDGATVRPRRGWPLGYRIGSRRFDRLQTLLNAVTVVGTVFRAETFRKIGGFPDRFQFYQDMELYSALVEHGDAVYVPATIGQYRDTPLRPANLLRFAEEEILWLKERLKCWPSSLRPAILNLWASRRRVFLANAVPDLVASFDEFLSAQGVAYRKSPAYPAALDQIHRTYKVWCSCLCYRSLKRPQLS